MDTTNTAFIDYIFIYGNTERLMEEPYHELDSILAVDNSEVFTTFEEYIKDF